MAISNPTNLSITALIQSHSLAITCKSVNKIIEMYYTKESEDKFVEQLKSRSNTLRTLENSSIDLGKSKSLARLKNIDRESEAMLKQRYEDHLCNLKQSIRNLEQQCTKFGGIEFIKKEMDKNQLEKEEYVNYCMSRINKQFELPSIKPRSLSERSLKPPQHSKKDSLKYNKWFIHPQERFSKSKEATKYEWSKDAFIFNIMKKRDNVVESKYLPGFIAHSKQKNKRQPLFCQYTTIKKGL